MIKLDNNYTVHSDAYNWILRFEETKMGKDKEGNPKEILSVKETYHATFKQLVDKYINETLKEIPELNLILVKLQQIEELIESLKIKK